MERKPRHCRHYDGRAMLSRGETKCRAGVDPIAVFNGGKRFGWFKRAPCFEGTVTDEVCQHLDLPSWEEVDADRAAFEKHVESVVALIDIIPAEGDSGTVECPKCGGMVDWSRSDYNGHRRAQCRTPECLGFME